MWVQRRILKVEWTARMRSDEVLMRIREENSNKKVENILVGAYITQKLSAAMDHRANGRMKERLGKKTARNA